MNYLSYAEAFRRLHSRFPDLTPAEMRAWVWANDLPAYPSHQSLETPDNRFSWLSQNDLDALEDAVFLDTDVESLTPRSRYIDYIALLSRWSGHRQDAAEYIAKLPGKADSFELLTLDVLDRRNRPVTQCVWAVHQIESWEKSHLPTMPQQEPPTAPDTPASTQARQPQPKFTRNCKPDLLAAENEAYARARRAAGNTKPTYKQFKKELAALVDDEDYPCLLEVNATGLRWIDSDLIQELNKAQIQAQSEHLTEKTLRGRFTKAKQRNEKNSALRNTDSELSAKILS